MLCDRRDTVNKENEEDGCLELNCSRRSQLSYPTVEGLEEGYGKYQEGPFSVVVWRTSEVIG